MPKYFTLLGSLPHLPPFDQVERLPINQIRLHQRLKMLEPKDAQVMEKILDFLIWSRQPVQRSSAEVAEAFQQALEAAEGLKDLTGHLTFRMDLRLIVALIRRRHHGREAPALNRVRLMGRLAPQLVRNWDDADFRVEHLYPWVHPLRELIEKGDSVEVERMLLQLTWRHADSMGKKAPFSFESFLGYYFKWDIMRRWLKYDRRKAATRFEQLLNIITESHSTFFHGTTS